MLQRTVSYKSLLRFVGWCFLLYGTYLIVLALTSQSTMNNNTSPWIFEDPIGVRNYLLYGRPLMANPLLPVPLNSFLTPGPLFWMTYRACLPEPYLYACACSVYLFTYRTLVDQLISLVPYLFLIRFYRLRPVEFYASFVLLPWPAHSSS